MIKIFTICVYLPGRKGNDLAKKYRNIIIALVSIALMVSVTACVKNEQGSGE
jgi:hypothetical protein